MRLWVAASFGWTLDFVQERNVENHQETSKVSNLIDFLVL